MSEQPDVIVARSDCFKEIRVNGQIINLQYDGMKLTVFHDSLNFQEVLGFPIKKSKATINRSIECTLDLSPMQLKSWALLFNKELQKYEKLYGVILSPEEIRERHKNQSKGSEK